MLKVEITNDRISVVDENAPGLRFASVSYNDSRLDGFLRKAQKYQEGMTLLKSSQRINQVKGLRILCPDLTLKDAVTIVDSIRESVIYK